MTTPLHDLHQVRPGDAWGPQADMETLALSVDQVPRLTGGRQVPPVRNVLPDDAHFGIGQGVPLPPGESRFPFEWLSAVDLPVDGSGWVTALPAGWHLVDENLLPIALPDARCQVVVDPTLGTSILLGNAFLLNDDCRAATEEPVTETDEWSVFWSGSSLGDVTGQLQVACASPRSIPLVVPQSMFVTYDWCESSAGSGLWNRVWVWQRADAGGTPIHEDGTAAFYSTIADDPTFWSLLYQESRVVAALSDIATAAVPQPTIGDMDPLRLAYLGGTDALVQFYIGARTAEMRADPTIEQEIKDHISANYPLLSPPPGVIPYLSRERPVVDVEPLWAAGTVLLEELLRAVRRRDRAAALPLAQQVYAMWGELSSSRPDSIDEDQQAEVAALLWRLGNG